MPKNRSRRTLYICLLGVVSLSLLGVACDQLVLGSAEEGEPVVVRAKLYDPGDTHLTRQDLAPTNYLKIDEIELNLRDLVISGKSGGRQSFIIPDSLPLLAGDNLDIHLSEKQVPAGTYNGFTVSLAPSGSAVSDSVNSLPVTEPPSSISSSSQPPSGMDRGDTPGEVKGKSASRQIDRSAKHRPAKSNITDEDISRVATSRKNSSGKDFALKITGLYRGEPFVYRFDKPLDFKFKLDPAIEAGSQSDSLSVLKVLVEFKQWFRKKGTGEYLNPRNKKNGSIIDKQIRNSFGLNLQKGREDSVNTDDDQDGNDDEDSGGNDSGSTNPPELKIDDLRISEDDSLGRLNVSLSEAINSAVSFNYATYGKTAKSGADFDSTSGNGRIEIGETEYEISVLLHDDSVSEGTEEFAVQLTNPANAVFTDSLATVTIADDESKPAFSISDASATEGGQGLQFEITLMPAGTNERNVVFSTKDSTATFGEDYEATDDTLTFTSGMTTDTVTVAVIDDAVDESTEFIKGTIAPLDDSAVNNQVGVGSITDNDEPTLSVSDSAASEANGSIAIRVWLSAPSDKSIRVDYNTFEGTASLEDDFTATSGSLEFEPGSRQQTFSVPLLDDSQAELTESFTVELSDPVNATINDGNATATITNDDLPGITISDTSATEAGTAMIFDIGLSGPVEDTVTVDYTDTPGSATVDDADYEDSQGTVTFLPEETSREISIPLIDDEIFEKEQSFDVTLSNVDNGTISRATATGTITDDDPLNVSVNDVSSTEKDELSTKLTFTVSTEHAADQSFSVDYATADGTAKSSDDYESTSGTLNFADSDTSKKVSVTALGDFLDEDDETLKLNLSNLTLGSIKDSEGTGTIEDNDAKETLFVYDKTVSETTDTLDISLSFEVASGRTVSVDYKTVDGTAKTGVDYVGVSGTITLQPGETSETLPIVITGDLENDGSESFTVEFSNVENAEINNSEITVTIEEPT